MPWIGPRFFPLKIIAAYIVWVESCPATVDTDIYDTAPFRKLHKGFSHFSSPPLTALSPLPARIIHCDSNV